MSSEEVDQEWSKIVRCHRRPQIDDAVNICKMKGVTSVDVLFETLEKLLSQWFIARDTTGAWE
jgi:hypothetical protein